MDWSQQLPPQFSKTAQALSQLSATNYGVAFAAAVLTGARNGANGFPRITQTGLDIFAAAATNTAGQEAGQTPYNNWLQGAGSGGSGAPANTFFPIAGGLYLGDAADEAADWTRILAEHCTVSIKPQGGSTIINQPAITLPSGFGLQRTVNDSSGLGPFFSTHLGNTTGDNVFTFPDNTVFEAGRSYQCLLKPSNTCLAALANATGDFPPEGMVIGFAMAGIFAFGVGAQRG